MTYPTRNIFIFIRYHVFLNLTFWYFLIVKYYWFFKAIITSSIIFFFLISTTIISTSLLTCILKKYSNFHDRICMWMLIFTFRQPSSELDVILLDDGPMRRNKEGLSLRTTAVVRQKTKIIKLNKNIKIYGSYTMSNNNICPLKALQIGDLSVKRDSSFTPIAELFRTFS